MMPPFSSTEKLRNTTPPYTDVSVLLLGWQDDAAGFENIRALQQVLVSDYHYHIQIWRIPSAANPGLKLGMQMSFFLERARPNQLLIIYYSGHGYVSSDGQLYWAWYVISTATRREYTHL
jgi:hypothetical protein